MNFMSGLIDKNNDHTQHLNKIHANKYFDNIHAKSGKVDKLTTKKR